MRKLDPARVLLLDAAYDDSMAKAVEQIFDTFPISWNGKRVIVKPNILGPYPPEKGVTTHPSLLRAVVRQLKKRGATVMVGDNSGIESYGSSTNAAKNSGLADASEGCFINFGHHPVRYPIKSKYIDTVTIAKEVLDADIVVNLPKLKTHMLTYLTAAVKNTFGYIVGGDKIFVHSLAPTSQKFAEAIVSIYKIRPPDLTILDAVIAMEGNGPVNGTPRFLGKIVAGTNAVTVDAVALHIIGYKVNAVPHLELAAKQGLGEANVSRVSLNQDVVPVTDFRFPSTFVHGIGGVLFNRIMSRWIHRPPEVITDQCQTCGICTQHCPVDAMQTEGDFPRVDQNKCICCYCCQEMCPEDAVKLSSGFKNLLRGSFSL